MYELKFKAGDVVNFVYSTADKSWLQNSMKIDVSRGYVVKDCYILANRGHVDLYDILDYKGWDQDWFILDKSTIINKILSEL